jgi:type 2 lantibiotic biosynthesis protein LanM
VTFLDTADRIGARLCRDALWSGGRCNWFGTYWAEDGETVHRTLGPNVYSGTSGIALFLGHLFQATGEKIFRITAEGAMRQAISRRNSEDGPGFYSGASGIALASVRVGEIADNSGFIEEGLAIAGSSVPRAEFLDVVNGSAGAIPVFLHLHRKLGGDAWLELAIRHGDALVDAANKADSGWSWATIGDGSLTDLTGFSHGAAGIAWALLELFHETREDKFRAAAEEGFRYERSCFDSELENWPDFREPGGPYLDPPPRFLTAWCHGAPGIGLSRLRAWQILGGEVYREEAETAIRTTLKSFGDEESYCLCHGHAGNAELLLSASEVLGKPEYQEAAVRIGVEGAERIEGAGLPWHSGGPTEDETPDLMLGLAGIGYFYLRLYDRARNASVLMLGGNSSLG